MSGGGTAPTAFTPPNQAGAAQGLSQSANSLQSLGQTTTAAAIPGYQSIYNAVVNNPYYAGAQASANQTGAAGTTFGQGEVTSGQGLQNLAGSLGQYQTGIAQTAFDPQHSLYNQQYNQNQQQTNAGLAQAGLAGGPFGAGEAQQSGQNFNMNWQNNQQTRQNAGVAALGSLDQTIGSLATAGGALGTAGLNTMETAGQLPNQVYNQQQTYIDNALNSLVQGDVAAGAPFSSAAAADTSYLGIGQQAAANNLASFQAQQQADNAFWNGIGGILGGLSGGGGGGGAMGLLGLVGL